MDLEALRAGNYISAMNKETFWRSLEWGKAPEHNPKMGRCLVWKKAKSRSGYGVVFVDRVQYRAHRFAYIDRVGPIPEGMCIDHLCRNRACCNVKHMDVTTPAENTRRCASYRKMRNGRPRANWLDIISDRASGMKYREIAAKHKMSISGVYLACNPRRS